MARKNDKKPNWRALNARLDTMDAQMKDAYGYTYHADKSTSNDMKMITDDIMDSIDRIVANSSDIQGSPNISRLYRKLNAGSNRELGKFNDQVFDIVNDKAMMNNLMDTYSKSRSIRMFDDQIDTICKYMPKMEDALVIKRDNVLSADNFTKDYINLISGLNTEQRSFAVNAMTLKDKYNLQAFFDDVCLRTSKYGETFIYCVPYKRAMAELLKKRGAVMNGKYVSSTSQFVNHESYIIENGSFVAEPGADQSVLTESANMDKILHNMIDTAVNDIAEVKGTLKLNFKVGMLDEVVADYDKAEKIRNNIPSGIYEQFVQEGCRIDSLTEAAEDNTFDSKKNKVKMSKLIPDELDYDSIKDDDRAASDGFIDRSKSEPTITVPGSILKVLDRAKVIPIYIEDICLGYYYIEYLAPGYIDSTATMKDSAIHNRAMENAETDDAMVRYISKRISDKIDASFINANADLSKEIYMILKYDSNFNPHNPDGVVNANFIPADDLYHHYYNLDPKTHRGISDIYKGMIPATIWCMITLCTAIGIVTRGQDKRVYYVQQSGVETNVAKNLINVINQIKKGNFGVRQMESINNILGIVGKFNDHVIPVGPSGEPPVRFEIMQGQNIETPVDLLTQMEENAINSTDVPLEIVNSSKQMDYAIHYTQSNAKFLTIVYKRQAIEQKMQSKIVTKLYNCEFGENTVVKVMLPAPKTLSMSQSAQLLDQTQQYVDKIAELYATDLTEDEKAEFRNCAMRYYLPAHVNVAQIDNLKSLAKINAAVKAEKMNQQEEQ